MLIHVLSFSVVLILQASSIKDAKPFLFKSFSKHSLAVSHFLVVSLLWSLALSPGSPGVSPPLFPTCLSLLWSSKVLSPAAWPPPCPPVVSPHGDMRNGKRYSVGCKIIYHIYIYIYLFIFIYVCVHAHLADFLKKKHDCQQSIFWYLFLTI